VSAYETGAIAEMKKWVQRNKGLASAAAALIVVLAGATVVVANKNREVEAKNVALGTANVEITKQKSEVEAKNVALGAANTEITRQKAEVEARRAEVEARKAEFDQLSGVVLLETANERAALYPPVPAKVEPAHVARERRRKAAGDEADVASNRRGPRSARTAVDRRRTRSRSRLASEARGADGEARGARGVGVCEPHGRDRQVDRES
jgi:hypothetical protein